MSFTEKIKSVNFGVWLYVGCSLAICVSLLVWSFYVPSPVNEKIAECNSFWRAQIKSVCPQLLDGRGFKVEINPNVSALNYSFSGKKT